MSAGRQFARGATTLVTVMVLFFVMALVAAYANRNLIVEQRIARSYQELGTASEGAYHAIHRTLDILNSGNINDQCVVDAGGAATARARYLVFAGDEGTITTPIGLPVPAGSTDAISMICDRSGAGAWRCQCPSDFQYALASGGTDLAESVAVRFYAVPGTLGQVRVKVQACTTPSAQCTGLNFGDGASVARSQLLVLLRALKMPPVSAVVARSDVQLGAAPGAQIVNNEAAGGGLALHAGGVVSGSATRVRSAAGSTVNTTLASDAELSAATPDAFFRRFFGMPMGEYNRQAAMRTLPADCGADCAADLQALAQAGVQLVRFEGELSLSNDVVVGSRERPVVLIVNGRLNITGPLQFTGLIYAHDTVTWSNVSANAAVVNGALVTAGGLNLDAGTAVVYDSGVLNNLKVKAGSFVRVPGGVWSQ